MATPSSRNMSNDIVELAIDQFTDGTLFEKIAAEVMRDEGYHNIRRLGGSNDFGMDAVQDVIYAQDDPAKIIFQFTLEDYVLGKLRDTIEKLRANSIEFTELVVVTAVKLSTERQENVRTTARKEYGVSASCFHRETIVNRLSDYANGIFHRTFPSIEQQLKELREAKPVLRETDDAREMALLKVAISFGMSKEAVTVRTSLFDHMVLATMAIHGESAISASDIGKSIGKSLGCDPFQPSQIEASLTRCSGDVEKIGDKYSIKSEARQRANAATTKVNSLTYSLVSDVVECVSSNAPSRLTPTVRQRLERNAKEVIREVFRTNSMDLAQLAQPGVQQLANKPDISSSLLTLAKRQVSDQLGGLLIAALADAFSDPREEQAQILAQWARVYLGVAAMNLDPVLREFQVSRIRDKVFILDTDVVLSAVVAELPEQPLYVSLISHLVATGARVVVPEAVIEECARHAARSPRTFQYHGFQLLAMSPQVVTVEVRNLFVRAYYHGIKSGRIDKSWGFDRYIENYFEPQEQIAFFREVVRAALPDEVEIIDIDKVSPKPLDKGELTEVTEKLLEVMERRATAFDTRTKEQKRSLAATDAQLLLTTLQVNSASAVDPTSRLLWAKCYIVTNSTRYSQTASELNLNNVVSSSPLQLLTVFERVDGPVVPDEALLRLFENPLVVGAVTEIWPDCEALLKNGISLAGKSLVRLRRDLDATLHTALIDAKQADESADESADTDAFVKLADSASALGYAVHPLAKTVRELLATQDQKDEIIKQLESQLDEVNQVVDQFGKKKQRYLRRISRKKAD